MLADLRAQLGPAIGDGPPEINAAARAVVLVARLEIGGARRQAQTAMDAVHEQLVVDVTAQLESGVVDHGQWGRCGHEDSVSNRSRFTDSVQIPATNRPGLKMPRGSRCRFT